MSRARCRPAAAIGWYLEQLTCLVTKSAWPIRTCSSARSCGPRWRTTEDIDGGRGRHRVALGNGLALLAGAELRDLVDLLDLMRR